MRLVIVFMMLFSLLNAKEVVVEVLGSTEVEQDGSNAMSYLIWIDKKARIIVDMGSTSFSSFKRSKAEVEDLELVVLTHLHIDHSSDLPLFIEERHQLPSSEPLEVLAPTGDEKFPSGSQFLEQLLSKKATFKIVPIDINDISIDSYKDFKVSVIRVYHGLIPSLSVRIDVGDKSIVISGDTTNKNHDIEFLSIDADLFIVDYRVAEDADGYKKTSYMNPNTIAKIVQKAGVQKVLLTHRVKSKIGKEESIKRELSKHYKGEIVFAENSMKLEI